MQVVNGTRDCVVATCSGRDATFASFRTLPCRRHTRYHAGSRRGRALVRCSASEPGASQGMRNDAFKAAAIRLQNLLSGVGDGEEEFLSQMLESESPEYKLTLCLAAGAVLSAVACGVCWLAGADPLGGASLSEASVHAAAAGALAGVPLAASRVWVWSDAGKAAYPPFEELQAAKTRFFAPIICNMTPPQTALIAAVEVLPTVAWVLPAAQGGLAAAFALYGSVAADAVGGGALASAVPDGLPAACALGVTACLAGFAEASEFSVSDEEYEQINDSVTNADRYYRLMAMTANAQLQDAESAASAYKAVAVTWLARRTLAARMAAVLAAVEVVYLTAVWQQAGDLSAAAAAASVAAAVEFTCLYRRVHVPGSRK